MKLYILPNENVRDLYTDYKTMNKENVGIDIFCPVDIRISGAIPGFINEDGDNLLYSIRIVGQTGLEHLSNMIDLQIRCKMINSDGKVVSYELRSQNSIGSKTELRLSNSIDLIDAGCRDNVKTYIDNFGRTSFISKGNKLVQITAPGLVPIKVVILDSEKEFDNISYDIISINQDFYNLLELKRNGVLKYHKNSTIGDENIRDLFTNPNYPEVATKFANSKWITPGDSKNSLFLTDVCSKTGSMSKVFNDSQLKIISLWIDSLEK